MNTIRKKRTRAAFTMVEIIVVVIIIAALAGLILPKFIGRVGSAKQSVAKQKLSEIEKAVDTFSYDYGRLPVTLNELVSRPSDVSEEKWNAPSLRSKDLLDPWGREFVYQQPGEHGPYDLMSYGADGQPGGEKENADVVNWE
jgi:general secretion pathway protein G